MTETELESLVVKLTGDDSKFMEMMKQVQQASADTTKKVEENAKQIENQSNAVKTFAKGALDALISLGASSYFKGALSAYEGAEKASARMNAAIEANGGVVSNVLPKYKAFADVMAQTTLQSKGNVLGMLQEAESMGLSGEAAMRAVKNSIAIAAAKNGEASSFLRATIALEDGDTALIARVLRLKSLGDETAIAATAQDTMNKMFKVAEAEANTVGRDMEMLGKTFAGLKKDAGELVSKAVRPFVDYLTILSDMYKQLDKQTKDAIVLAGTFGIAIIFLKSSMAALAALGIGPWVKWMFTLTGAMQTAKIAIASFGVYLGYEFAKYIFDTDERVRSLNSALEQSKKLNDQLQQLDTKKRTKVFEQATTIKDTNERVDFYDAETSKAEKEVAGLQRNVEALERSVKRLTPSWYTLWQGGKAEYDLEKKFLEDTKTRLDQTRLYVSKLKEEAEKLREKGPTAAALKMANDYMESLEKQARTLGMTADEAKVYEFSLMKIPKVTLDAMRTQIAYNKAMSEYLALRDDVNKFEEELTKSIDSIGITGDKLKIWELKQRGASDASLETVEALVKHKEALEEINKLMEEGKALTDQYLTPQEKMNKELAKLDKMLGLGAINQQTYERAVGAAKKEVLGLNAALERNELALVGSADAIARVNEYTEKQKANSELSRSFKTAADVRQEAPVLNLPQKVEFATIPREKKGVADNESTVKMENLLSEILKTLRGTTTGAKGTTIEVKPTNMSK